MLLFTDEFTNKLKLSIKESTSSITVASAFIKEYSLIKLFSSMTNKNFSITVIARWKKHDLLAGASDLSVYSVCKKHGWKFGIDKNLHGKLYLIDNDEIFLGSANLTSRGLGLTSNANLEFGTKMEASDVDLKKIDNFIEKSVTWMDDKLFQQMEMEVEAEKNKNIPITSTDSSWSSEINKLLEKPVEYLWVQELVFKSPNELLHLNLDDENTQHDFELLNLNLDLIGSHHLKQCFMQTKLYFWLTSLIHKNESINFGGITAALHAALLDDPVPYRKNVKEFVQVIFTWLEFMDDNFTVTKHNRTSSVKINKDK